MSADTVSWLVQEIRDLLDVSSVGLYEFMWILNTPDQSLSIDERKSIARQALGRLMAEPGVELEWLQWPDWNSLGKVSIDQLPADPWGDPDDHGRYLALNRSDGDPSIG